MASIYATGKKWICLLFLSILRFKYTATVSFICPPQTKPLLRGGQEQLCLIQHSSGKREKWQRTPPQYLCCFFSLRERLRYLFKLGVSRISHRAIPRRSELRHLIFPVIETTFCWDHGRNFMLPYLVLLNYL